MSFAKYAKYAPHLGAIKALMEKDFECYTDITFVDVVDGLKKNPPNMRRPLGHVLRSLTILNPEGEDIVVTERSLFGGEWEIHVKIGEEDTAPWPKHFTKVFEDAVDIYGPVSAIAVSDANYRMGLLLRNGAPSNRHWKKILEGQSLPHYTSVYEDSFTQRCSELRLESIQGRVPGWFPVSLADGPETVWVLESPAEWQKKYSSRRRQTRYGTFHDAVMAKRGELLTKETC